MKTILFFIISSIMFAQNINTNYSVEGSLNITANIINNLTIENSNMEFNDIPLASDAIAFTHVDIDGSSSTQDTVTISIPKTIQMRDGNKTMTLNLSSERKEKLVLDEDGKGNVKIKGTLNAEDTTVIGDYTGTFDVTVKYD
ncbi:MAG: DUF4402 domain-containing protein [Fusobacterium sp.]